MIKNPAILIRIIFLDIVFPIFFFTIGIFLILGTVQEWPSIANPSEGSNFIYGQSFIRKKFGKEFLKVWNCLIGIIFISFGKGLAINIFHQIFN